MQGWKSLAASLPLPLLPVSSSGASPHAARVAVASSATRPLVTTFLVFLTKASKIDVVPGVGPHIGRMMPPTGGPWVAKRRSVIRL